MISLCFSKFLFVVFVLNSFYIFCFFSFTVSLLYLGEFFGSLNEFRTCNNHNKNSKFACTLRKFSNTTASVLALFAVQATTTATIHSHYNQRFIIHYHNINLVNFVIMKRTFISIKNWFGYILLCLLFSGNRKIFFQYLKP